MSNEIDTHPSESSTPNTQPPRLLLIVLNGIAALLCAVAAILSFMGENGTSIKVGSVRVVNLTFLAGFAAFACFLVSFIAVKRKWKPSGASGVKAAVLILLFLLFCLLYVFREPAELMVDWTRASPVNTAVHYRYEVLSDYDGIHSVGHDRARSVAFFGSRRSFRVFMEGDSYASCQSSPDACALTECEMDQIWWVGGLQWGVEVDWDAGASGLTKALICRPVDRKAITLESYDEYGYRYE